MTTTDQLAHAGDPGTPGLWRQARVIAANDLLRERRRGEVMWVTLPFGAIALLLIPMAIGIDTPTLQRIGPGLYWVVVLLFGVLVAVRASATEDATSRALQMRLGVDPVASFAGRATATIGLLMVFQVVVGLVAVALYDLDLSRWPWMLAVLPLVAIGLGLLGTLAGALANGVGGGNLVPFLVAPLAIPLLLGATQVLDSSADDGLGGGAGILAWVLLMLLVDVVMAVAGVLTARPLQETM